jgi:HEPN domain-containing protein
MIAGWRGEAQDALDCAQRAHVSGNYALALLKCHLAVECALKAAFTAAYDALPPPTHSLLELAHDLNRPWTDSEQALLYALADFALFFRSGNQVAVKDQPTASNSAHWLPATDAFVTRMLL